MGTLAAVEAVPTFVTGAELSAADVAILRTNILALSGASYLPPPPFEWRWSNRLENWRLNPSPFWYGSFRFLSGMTTLYIYVNNASLTAGDKLRVLLNGSGTDTTLTAGAQTITRTISGLGYDDGEVVELTLQLYNATRPATNTDWGTTKITDIVIAPVQVADAYPGVPTFGAITAANLNQLSNAVDWLIRTMGLLHRPLFQSVIRENGPYGARTLPTKARQDDVRWNGSVRRTNEHAVLTAEGSVLVLFGYAEEIYLKVNGSTVATYTVPTTAGEYDWSLAYTLTTTVDAIVEVEIQHVRTFTPELATPQINRVTVWRVWVDRASDPTPISIVAMPARTSGTFTALQTYLNALCTHVTTIKARIDANPDVWNRQRPYKRRQGLDNFHLKYYAPNRIAWSPYRTGEALIVRGKGLALGWGPLVLKDEPDSPDKRFWAVAYVLSEGLATADEVRQVTHYLDSFEALTGGAAFAVLGEELYYAAEQLLDTLQGVL